MRAIQITETAGPETGLELVDVPEPESSHFMTPGSGVLVEVHAAGVSFPELLQSRGMYQLRPDLPFIPGSEVGGVVRSAPEGSALRPGDRVAAFSLLGAWAETVVAPEWGVFPIPDAMSFRQACGLVLNHHTAYFTLVTRGRLAAGETVLIHGAAGGVGTATIQVAKGLGARTIAVVSSEEKERVARDAGADVVLRSDGPWKDEALEASGGGVDIVIDPVGGERFLDSLRSLARGGRLVVVGFTAGIPEVKVNRLLLRNVDVVGAAWGGWALEETSMFSEIGAALDELIAAGHIDPIVGPVFPLERAADALLCLDRREAVGKIVLDVRGA